MVGQGFIPDPLRALCGAVKELYRRQLQPQTKKFEIMYATKSRSILYRMLTSAR
jgi:gluconate kinase